MKKSLSIILIILLLLPSLPLAAAGAASDLDMDLETACNALYLVNLDTGRVVYEKNADLRISPASTTKIMTAALAMELCADLKGTAVTVPEDVWAEFEGINISNAGLVGRETLSMYDLLHCMLLQSANEAASTVAAYYGGQSYIERMNAKAAELGCTGTHFTNPHGLYGEEHYTTARDLYTITRWALSVPGFYEICQKTSYTLPATEFASERELYTTIYMQDPDSRYYTSYIKGIKTGTIDQSGRCLVSTAEKNGLSFLLVAMGAPFEPVADDPYWPDGSSVFVETRQIYDWAFESCELVTAADADTVVTSVELKYAKSKDSLLLYPDREVSALVSSAGDGQLEITFETELPEYVKAPVEAGQAIGSARVFGDGILLGECRLISRENVEFSRLAQIMDFLTEVFTSRAAQILLGVIFVAVLFYLYYIFVLVAKNKKKKRRR